MAVTQSRVRGRGTGANICLDSATPRHVSLQCLLSTCPTSAISKLIPSAPFSTSLALNDGLKDEGHQDVDPSIHSESFFRSCKLILRLFTLFMSAALVCGSNSRSGQELVPLYEEIRSSHFSAPSWHLASGTFKYSDALNVTVKVAESRNTQRDEQKRNYVSKDDNSFTQIFSTHNLLNPSFKPFYQKVPKTVEFLRSQEFKDITVGEEPFPNHAQEETLTQRNEEGAVGGRNPSCGSNTELPAVNASWDQFSYSNYDQFYDQVVKNRNNPNTDSYDCDSLYESTTCSSSDPKSRRRNKMERTNKFRDKVERCFGSEITWTAYHEYCVVGAGPAGLQMGYFLQHAARDYVIYERHNISGSFFDHFPRHRRLVSINKRFTGKTNSEFQLRHDWNSLLSDDEDLLFRHFSKDYFPHADSMITYLNEYKRKLNINVKYNMEIRNVRKISKCCDGDIISLFLMNNGEKGDVVACRYLIVASGIWKPNTPHFEGSELVEGYEMMDLSTKRFEGKNVLILGRGNSAFETADSLYGHTNFIHMVSRSRARMAWNTHYVGDLRAVNNGLLDAYQLKSLDGLLEASVEEMKLERRGKKIYVQFPAEMAKPNFSDDIIQTLAEKDETTTFRMPSPKKEKGIDNFSLREGYDHVIRCLGFQFDYSLFHNSTRVSSASKTSRYPAIKGTFESKTIPDLYFAGTAAHSIDYRKSSGGFVHGFRYTVRALHRLLEWKNHQKKWPSQSYSSSNLLNILIKRVNEASGPYQMYQMLGDVVIFRKNGLEFEFLEEFPIQLLPQLHHLTGHNVDSINTPILVLVMEYGPDFSGPDKDTLRTDRATGDPLEAHRSNFLHPVLYFYKHMLTEAQMLIKWSKLSLPRPSRLHHILEDFLTSWTAQQSHILPLRRFLETILKTDLRHHYASECLKLSLTLSSLPFKCSPKSNMLRITEFVSKIKTFS